MQTTAETIRVEDIQRATVNGRAVKLFKVFERCGDAFFFVGQFSAPAKTPTSRLAEYYISTDDDSEEQQGN